MRKFARRFLFVLPCAAIALLVALWCLYRASQQAPAFYKHAMAHPPTALRDQGQQFEHQALALHNQLTSPGDWEIRFTQDEINGWLGTDLPTKFPRLLPPGISDPRIAILGDQLHLAVHYWRGGVDTIVSFAGEASLTNQPNEIALRIDQARAGMLPIPLVGFVQETTDRAARANIRLSWTEDKGAPVALIRLPLAANKDHERRVVLEQLRLHDGQVVISGRTLERVLDDKEPGSPVTAAQGTDSETRQR